VSAVSLREREPEQKDRAHQLESRVLWFLPIYKYTTLCNHARTLITSLVCSLIQML